MVKALIIITRPESSGRLHYILLQKWFDRTLFVAKRAASFGF